MKTYQNLPLYRAKVDLDYLEENDLDFSFDLVSQAANLYEFLAFGIDKETEVQELQYKLDDDKMVITGPTMVPDMPNYRKGKRGENGFYTFFSKEDTKNALLYFNKKGNTSGKVELNHQSGVKIPGVVFENWIVENQNIDKAKHLGFNVNEGTWMSSIQITDRKFWNEQIKTGKVKGFSVISKFDLSGYEIEIINKNKTEMKKQNIKTLKFESQIETLDGVVIVVDELTEGANIWVLDGEAKTAAPVGEYVFADGKIIVTEAGIVGQIVKNDAADESKKDEPKAEEFKITKEQFEALTKANVELLSKFEAINKSITDLNKSSESFKKDNEVKIEELKLKIEKAAVESKAPVQKQSEPKKLNLGI